MNDLATCGIILQPKLEATRRAWLQIRDVRRALQSFDTAQDLAGRAQDAIQRLEQELERVSKLPLIGGNS